MKKNTFLFAALAIVLMIWSCTKDTTTAAATIDCSNVSAKFATDIKPIFQAKCGNQGCHPSKEMEVYASLKKHVNDGHIKRYIADRSTPPALMTLAGGCNDAESKKVACWIQSGALDN
jgi:hypothetical protein